MLLQDNEIRRIQVLFKYCSLLGDTKGWLGGGGSLVGQPLHKRGRVRVWSTSHHQFILQSQQWASSTRQLFDANDCDKL
jgi:hypothetical protein